MDTQECAAEHERKETKVAEETTADMPKGDRVQRIADYLESSLGKPDALQATIGAANSDLMLVGFRLNEAVQAALNSTPAALSEFGKLMPAVESLLKVYKQVDRFTQLEVRFSKAEKVKASVLEQESAAETKSEETAS